MIKGLKERYEYRTIGYSDHTLPEEMRNLETATLLGAEILEKHFTHNKSLPGNDHYHAMDVNDLKSFVSRLGTLIESLGQSKKVSLSSEESARLNARRSLVTLREIRKGEEINVVDLTYKRPGTGISPADIDEVVGKTTTRTVEEDEIVQWEMLK